jgi:hypothetical protein
VVVAADSETTKRPDISRADFEFGTAAITSDWSMPETAMRLMEESPSRRTTPV